MSLLFFIQNLKKHLWKINNLCMVLFTAVLFACCGKETDKKDYVARVNDSFLNKNDLEKFYQMYNSEFKLTNDGYLLNIVEFSKEEEAIDFRNSVLQNEWQIVIESGKYEDLLKKQDNILLSENEIYPF